MNLPTTIKGDQMLGGRLALLSPEQLTPEQRDLKARVLAGPGAQAEAAGYRITDSKGQLIGPFNALLRTPKLALGLAGWVAAISEAGLSAEVREVVILTVGAHWKADFELYAHSKAARVAGLSTGDVDALMRGDAPADVSTAAHIGYRVASALVEAQQMDQDLYNQAIRAFSEEGLISLIALVAQYVHTSMILTCFEAPPPE